MAEEVRIDRRQDVGQKMFIAIVSAILTTIFLGSLGLGFRAYEKGNTHEVRITVLEEFAKGQARLNEKLDKLLESSFRQETAGKYGTR